MGSIGEGAIDKQYAEAVMTNYGDWRDDFYRDGYAIVKGCIHEEKAKHYQSKALEWLQSFNLGFDPKDESTWSKAHLPEAFKGGMYLNYAVTHEKFMWDARAEPGVIEPFAKLWGTDELVVSFDGLNITLPRQKDLEFSPWPHCDQNPKRKQLACAQGIIQLSKNGPKDGGLIVMKGSAKLFEEFFSEPRKMNFDDPDKPPPEFDDLFLFRPEQLQWYKDRGCELVKVCADPGDVIIWDSRTMHYACFPEGDEVRTIIYACYTPAAFGTKEDLERKGEMFKSFEGTTHWPHRNIRPHGKAMINGEVDPKERDQPLELPEQTKRVLQLAAVETY